MSHDVWPLRPGCTIDLARLRVRRDGEEVALTAREGEVLRYLVEREGQDVSVEQLSREVSRAAQSILHRLQRKLERAPSSPEHLLTVQGVGYRLVRAATEPEELEAEGLAALEAGEHARAARLLERAHALLADVDAERRRELCRLRAVAAARLGRSVEAYALLSEGAPAGDPSELLSGWCALGEVEAALDHLDEARRALREAEQLLARHDLSAFARRVAALRLRVAGSARSQ